MPVILGANSASGGYNITNSLRFNSGSSDYLVRTPSSTTNQQIFTFSTWFKFSDVSATYNDIASFGASSVTNGVCYIDINSSKQLEIFMRASGTEYKSITTQLFRDVSAWYHIVIAVDTTQATSTNRTKVYVNGSQVSAFSTQNAVPQNTNLLVNTSSSENRIGASKDSGGGLGSYFNGYQTEIFLIDGQALTPSSFGETDEDTGIWKPKAYTGTYGTNGFYLQFKNSASLGTDSSGNGNNFTVNNLTSIDQTTDTPTNNFATMNPLFIPTTGTATFTQGNLQLSLDANDYGLISTMGVSSGKWYWEVKWTADSGFDRVGIKLNANPDQNPALSGIGWNRLSTSNGMEMLGSAVSGSWGSAFSVNDIISFALDCDNKALYIAQNGTWRNSGVPTSGASRTGGVDYSAQSTLTSDYLFPAVGKGNVGTTGFQFNFGNPPFTISSGNADANGYGNFEYAVPSGYYSLNTRNLANFG